MGSTKVTAEKMAQAVGSMPPVTIPQQAYGPQPVEWFDKRPVWAWVQWRDRAATREACWAVGANDRIVMLEIPSEGGHWGTVVWRNAVAVREVDRRNDEKPPTASR